MPSPSRVYLVATLLLAMSVSATDLVAQRHPSHRDDDHWLSDVPDGYSANLETGTVNGPMSVDFPITLMGRIGGRRITTTLGSGGPTVRVVTTNGPAIVRRN